jgi:hypothetical protein
VLYRLRKFVRRSLNRQYHEITTFSLIVLLYFTETYILVCFSSVLKLPCSYCIKRPFSVHIVRTYIINMEIYRVCPCNIHNCLVYAIIQMYVHICLSSVIFAVGVYERWNKAKLFELFRSKFAKIPIHFAKDA